MNHDALNRYDVRRQELLVRSLVRRGVVTETDAGRKMQEMGLRLDDGHRPTKVEHWEGYGVTAKPHPGAEVLVASIGGNPDHVVVIAAGDRRYRLKSFATGEMAIYDDQGQKVHITRDRIDIVSSKGVRVTGPLHVEGNITHNGNLSSTGYHQAGGGHT